MLTQESEAINSTVQLVIERLLGTFGDIEISYRTVEARSNSSFNERPAVPYQDFIPGANRIVMADGVNISTISINVIHVRLMMLLNYYNYEFLPSFLPSFLPLFLHSFSHSFLSSFVFHDCYQN